MLLRDRQRSGAPITTQYPQYPLTSNTESIQFTRHAQIGPANLIERTKINGLIASGAASTPRRKSPLSISYTPNDDGDSNRNNETDLPTDHDDLAANRNTVDYGRKHVAAGQSPDISTNINSSPHKNNKNNTNNSNNNNVNTSNHNTVMTHTLFDTPSRSYGDSQVKSELTSTSQTQATTNTASLKNEQRRPGSNRLSWMIQHIDKKPPSWVRGFFDKHQRVNDEVAAGNKSSPLPGKSASPATKIFSDRLSSPSLPLQFASYLSCKLSIPYLTMTNSNSNRQPSKRRYAKHRQKSRKTTNHHPRPVTPKHTDDATINRGQLRRQPLLESDVYRMSHMKLTNPRRTLREQVVIINSMFRYLSTLPMKHQHQHQQQQQWRLLYHISSPPNQTTTNSPSSALKNTPSKTSSLSQSLLPHIKYTLTASSTTP